MDEEMKYMLKDILIETKLLIIVEASKELNRMHIMDEEKYIRVLKDTIKSKREEIEGLTFGYLEKDEGNE